MSHSYKWDQSISILRVLGWYFSFNRTVCQPTVKTPMANDLLLCNMCLKKRNSHHITDRTGNTACVFFSKGPATDVIVFIGEEVALQSSAGKRRVD